jgi:hypothetical protein
MLIFEISDTILGILVGLMGVFACGSYCSFSYKHITKLLQLIFLTYLSNAVILFQTLLDILFAWQRLKSFVSTYKPNQKNFKLNLALMLVIALVLTAPSYIITRKVAPIGILRHIDNKTNNDDDDEILFSISSADFAQNDYWTYSILALNIFNGFILYNILLCINLLVIFRFKTYMANKRNHLGNHVALTALPLRNNEHHTHTHTVHNTHNNETNKPKIIKGVKTTKTVLAMNINFLVGNLPISISPIIFQFSGYSTFYNYYTIVTVLVGLLTHPGYFFLYCILNPLFRKTLLDIYVKRSDSLFLIPKFLYSIFKHKKKINLSI